MLMDEIKKSNKILMDEIKNKKITDSNM